MIALSLNLYQTEGGVRQFGDPDSPNGIALTKNLTKRESIKRHEEGQEAVKTAKLATQSFLRLMCGVDQVRGSYNKAEHE